MNTCNFVIYWKYQLHFCPIVENRFKKPYIFHWFSWNNLLIEKTPLSMPLFDTICAVSCISLIDSSYIRETGQVEAGIPQGIECTCNLKNKPCHKLFQENAVWGNLKSHVPLDHWDIYTKAIIRTFREQQNNYIRIFRFIEHSIIRRRNRH